MSDRVGVAWGAVPSAESEQDILLHERGHPVQAAHDLAHVLHESSALHHSSIDEDRKISCRALGQRTDQIAHHTVNGAPAINGQNPSHLATSATSPLRQFSVSVTGTVSPHDDISVVTLNPSRHMKLLDFCDCTRSTSAVMHLAGAAPPNAESPTTVTRVGGSRLCSCEGNPICTVSSCSSSSCRYKKSSLEVP